MDCEATTAARFHRQEETPHQGWMKPFLELTPGPNPAEQQSRAWGCPPARVAPAQAVGRARDRDQSGVRQGSSLLTPLCWVPRPPVLGAGEAWHPPS